MTNPQPTITPVNKPTIDELEANGQYMGKYHNCPFYKLGERYYFIQYHGLFREVHRRTWCEGDDVERWLETWVLPDLPEAE